MRKYLIYFYSITPYFELLVRRIYFNLNLTWLLEKFRKICRKKKKYNQALHCNILKKYINKLNIKKGDILILHSSMSNLMRFDCNPSDIIDYLLDIIGENGTLVMPTFEDFSKKGDLIFNVNKKHCSTGLIPNIFLRKPSVIRSKFPINNLSALGPHSKLMMENNLNTDLAHGINSSWEYCYRNDAKILLLGVSATKSLTMVHVAEDILDDNWPVRNWYEKKKIKMVKNEKEEDFLVRIRKENWSKYNTAYYRTFMLKKNKILIEDELEKISIGFVESSKSLVEYIISLALSGKLFFKIPKKHLK